MHNYYCRFGNTRIDFAECLDALTKATSFTDMKLGEIERQSMDDLAVLARKYLERYAELQELAEYEFARNIDTKKAP